MGERERERMRTRERVRRQQRTVSSNRDPTGEEPVPGGKPVGRRTLLAGFGAILGAGAVGGYLFSGPATLPQPVGQAAGPEYRAATLAIKPAPKTTLPPSRASWTSCLAGQPEHDSPPSDLDLVLAIDTTGSMGSVINDVKAQIVQLLSSLGTGRGDVRVGLVAYRDYGDTYVVRSYPLTSLRNQAGIAALNTFVAGLQAAGGNDWPEAMASALEAATSMDWRGNVPAVVVVIADAPAHPNEEGTARSIAENFRGKIPGAQVSVIDTGSGGNAFMRALPKTGGGQYVTYDGHILNSLYPAITGCPSL